MGGVSARMVRRGAHAPARAGARPASCAVITVSDTRGAADDGSGDAIARRLANAGHTVASRAWVPDHLVSIRRAVRAALTRRDIDAVILTGGTGVSPRDRTPEALAPLLERDLPGFGERFRHRSFEQVGAAAWLSRAGAGVARGRLIVFLPGSTAAVELALDEILLPELVHVLRLLGRQSL